MSREQSGTNTDQDQGAGVVTESRDWYRDQYRRVLIGGGVLLILLGLSLSFNFAQWYVRPQPVYFAVTPELKIQQLRPLSEPNMTQSGLLNWTTSVINETLSLNFLDWRKTLMRVRPNYTDQAYIGLLQALKESGNLNAIRERRMNASSVVSAAPVITAKGVLHGVMTWRVEFPLLITYEDSDGVVSSQKLFARVMVQRVDVNKRPKGVQINQIILGTRGA